MKGLLGPGAEFDLIRRLLAQGGDGQPPEIRVGPGDDCAVVDAGPLAISVDMAVEGVHYRRAWLRAEEVGWRVTAGALSDLAAVAARPLAVLTSMALTADDVADGWAERLARGVADAAASVGASVVGGDVTATPGPTCIDVVVLGAVERAVLRSGARPGDRVWVTGRLGGAAAAVRAWEAGGAPTAEAREAFARPRPRVAEARWLAERAGLTSLIDLSDGLAGDAAHIAAASGVAVVLEASTVPLHAAVEGREDALRLALGGGEDFELCFTTAEGALEDVREAFEAAFALPLTPVGLVRVGEGVYIRGSQGRETPLDGTGYRHFAP